MPNTRVRVWFSDDVMDAVGKAGASLSHRLSVMIVRFRAMCLAAMPDFTEAEWRVILDANNPTSDADHLDAPEPERLWKNLDQTPETASLSARLQSLSRVELIAVQEACSRYWAHDTLSDGERFEAAWIVVSDPMPGQGGPSRLSPRDQGEA